MSHHVVETASTGEGQSFNFTKWIQENNLNDIKHLFIKHEMTTLDTLSMQSQQYQRFMSDPQFYSKHGNLIAPLINAMQNLPSLQTSSQSIIKVIISEEEQASIIDIENKLKTLDVMEQNIHSFNQTYPQSISKIQQEKLKQISAMKDKINQIFDGLYNKLKNKQTILLKSVEEMEQKVNNNDKGDEKEMDVLSVARNELHNHRIYLQDKLKECDKLTSNNDKRQQRKQTILNMANDVSEKYESTKESIDDIMKNINGVIKQNESTRINIDFILNDVEYKDIIKNINNIGSIVNEVEVNNLPPFKWYREQHGKGAEFVNDVSVKVETDRSAICVADHVVSSDEYFHYFEWEIQIDECANAHIFFGLVDAPISKNITNWDTYLAKKNSNDQYFVLIDKYVPKKYFRIHDT
eukprot:27558_1